VTLTSSIDITFAVFGNCRHDSSINLIIICLYVAVMHREEWSLKPDRFSNLRSKCISISRALQFTFSLLVSFVLLFLRLNYITMPGLSNSEIILQMFLYHCHWIYPHEIFRECESYESSEDALDSSDVIPLCPFTLIIQHAID